MGYWLRDVLQDKISRGYYQTRKNCQGKVGQACARRRNRSAQRKSLEIFFKSSNMFYRFSLCPGRKQLLKQETTLPPKPLPERGAFLILGFPYFTKSEDETISWAEDYEVKFAWAMFDFQSLTSAPPCAGQQ